MDSHSKNLDKGVVWAINSTLFTSLYVTTMNRFKVLTIFTLAASLQLGCQTLAGGSQEKSIVDSPKVDPVAELHTKLGTGYMREGQLDLAWQRLNKALLFDPKYSTAHNAMALLYERLEKPNDAETHYKDALRYNPSDSSARTNYGSFLCRQGRIDDAAVQFDEALSNPLYRSREIPFNNYGLCLHKHGDLENAETYLRQALELNPRIASALIAMSDLSLAKGQKLSARAYIERYAAVSKHSPRTLLLGVRIERALGDLDAAASYAMQLKSNYPDSEETRQLLDAEDL